METHLEITEKAAYVLSDLALNQFCVEAAADEVFWMQSDSRILYVNRSACEKLEYKREELIGKYVWEWDPLFAPERWPAFFEELREKKAMVFETKHMTRTGRVYPVEIRAHYTERDAAPHLFAFVTDISSRVEKVAIQNYQDDLERLVEARTREIERFAYHTSHDLKAPLSASRCLAQFIKLDIEQGNLEEAKLNAEKIVFTMSRTEALVKDLMSLVRAGLNTEAPEEFYLKSLLDELLHQSLDSAEAHGCEIRACISIERPVSLPKIRLTQILENLLENGVKYRDREKEHCFVELRIGESDHGLVIEVEDNGVGVASHDHSKLFERFTRCHPELSTGSGLGLSIVKEHVERLNGTVRVESLKDGTRFEVRIPW